MKLREQYKRIGGKIGEGKLNEAPVDYSTMKLKSNIAKTWTSEKVMEMDLRQFIQANYAATGTVKNLVKVLDSVMRLAKSPSTNFGK